jgi:hypothetical protein
VSTPGVCAARDAWPIAHRLRSRVVGVPERLERALLARVQDAGGRELGDDTGCLGQCLDLGV